MQIMKKTPEQKAKRNNLVDVICDEIYGMAQEQNLLPEQVVLSKKDVRKLAKKVAKRWTIGPR